MKIQFKDLDYQDDAIQSAVKLFEGQQIRQSNFTISSNQNQGKLYTETGVGNNIHIQSNKMLQNLNQVQIDNEIPVSETLLGSYPQFNIEMETGTGKTYVYIKSILEMNRKYGFTKFVIVVPSVAIKEGVIKSFQMTREHFKSTMNGIVYREFMYDSSKLGDVYQFAQNDSIEIMVINIQAFYKGKQGSENMRIMYRDDRDTLFGNRPIDLIAATNPIVVIDEPQSVDNTPKAKEAIDALNPSAIFRYSATHREKNYPLIYKLGPVDAYDKELVKQIEVAGVENDVDGNETYLKLIEVKTTKKSLYARVEMYVKSKNDISKTEVKLKQGDDLYIKSKRIAAYEKVGFVRELSAESGNEYIEFSGQPSIIRLSQAVENDRQIKRGQIRKTIEEHLDKELKLNKKGIKVLSLFFIDNVSNYRQYDDDNNAIPGPYAKIFEEEYKKLISRPKYKDLQDKDIPVGEVHDGYFSIDSKKRYKDTGGETQADESTYKIIMEDKEDLLTFYDEDKGQTKSANKLRFIFSHSALKEGWDNPNVFQICTLVETQDSITKRQKIGRGLRIAVNQEGERVHGFDINTLTVMANESYKDFASGLQKEYEEEGIEFGVFDEHVFSTIITNIDEKTGLKESLGKEQSKKLHKFFKDSDYISSKNKGTEKLAEDLKNEVFDVPEEFKEIKEEIIELVQKKFDRNKMEIRNHDDRVKIKVKKEALAGPFLELWEKIKYKTSYSISFDSEQFINRAASELEEELQIRIARLNYNKAKLDTTESGVGYVNETTTTLEVSESDYHDAPDILSYLQNETNLTRKTIIQILKKSNTLRDFRRNPEMYMMEVAKLLNSMKRQAMVDGIKYEKNSDEKTYDQMLFNDDELLGYKEKVVEVTDNRSVYNYIEVDSEVEREFAIECEQDQDVKFYIKLPSWFKVKTPLGQYNPDWALLIEEYGKDKLYFVVETKGDTAKDKLRPVESAKIKCGRKHFNAIDTGVSFKKSTSLKEVL